MPDSTDDILNRVQDTLQATHIAFRQLTGEEKDYRIFGLRNIMVHGRAVTNVLQNLRSAVGTDVFNEWYEPYKREMQNDPAMKYLYKLRTEILKRGELELKTRVSVGLMGIVDLQEQKPAGAKSIFMDNLGGIGWLVDTGGGTTEKFYVNSSSNIDSQKYQAKLMFRNAPEDIKHEVL